jgi:hypothetical protein
LPRQQGIAAFAANEKLDQKPDKSVAIRLARAPTQASSDHARVPTIDHVASTVLARTRSPKKKIAFQVVVR